MTTNTGERHISAIRYSKEDEHPWAYIVQGSGIHSRVFPWPDGLEDAVVYRDDALAGGAEYVGARARNYGNATMGPLTKPILRSELMQRRVSKQMVHELAQPHNILNNAAFTWLIAQGYDARESNMVDIAVMEPPVIIETKSGVGMGSIREAVAQVQWYQHFEPTLKNARMVTLFPEKPAPEFGVFMASKGIGYMWRDGDTFAMSPLAKEAFGG